MATGSAPSSSSVGGGLADTAGNKIARFKAWLTDNGASFGKIEWPSVDTVGGCRGAQALADIASEEHMLEIPIKLMMSPPNAFADATIGPILRAHEDSLRGDLLLSLYIMFEMSKGSSSFYYPYLQVLPEPGSVSQWTSSQMQELQNEDLLLKAKNRLTMLRNSYNRAILPLCQRYPVQLPAEAFSYNLFLFAWYSVQARAFGRRLPWTAMVPFADCLNHSNLQTKYDYNVENNGIFRLFPSGSNCYPKGCEVFNSYGRRHNDNLLLDYGFAMLDNEWDQVDILLALERTEPNFEEKSNLLYAHLGLHHHAVLQLSRGCFPLEALAFMRVLSMSAEEMLQWGAEVSTAAAAARVSSAHSELRAVRRLVAMLDGLVLARVTTVREDEEALAELELGAGAAGGVGVGVGVEVEGAAATNAAAAAPAAAHGDTADDHWRTVCALTYRLTRKRIVDITIAKLRVLEEYLLDPAPRRELLVDELLGGVVVSEDSATEHVQLVFHYVQAASKMT